MDKKTEKVIPGTGVFLAGSAVIAVLLVLLIPNQTSPAPAGQGWWTQPVLMPALSLVTFAAAAVYLIVQHIRAARKSDVKDDNVAISAELFEWVKPLEFFVYYILYIWLLGIIGYFLSSAIFAVVVGWRVGLRSRKWVYVGIMFALTLTALFRWGLNIWVPAPWLFEQLPGGLRIFFIRNF